MGKRKIIHRNVIASSDNYELSMRLYRAWLLECHNKNIMEIQTTNSKVKIPYTMVFGKKVRLKTKETENHDTIEISWE